MSLFPVYNLPDETITQTIIHLPSSKCNISGISYLTAQFQFHVCWNFIKFHSKNNVLTAICMFWIMSCGLCSCQIFKDHVVAQVISCCCCTLGALFSPVPVSVWFLVGRMALGHVSSMYFGFSAFVSLYCSILIHSV